MIFIRNSQKSVFLLLCIAINFIFSQFKKKKNMLTKKLLPHVSMSETFFHYVKILHYELSMLLEYNNAHSFAN